MNKREINKPEENLITKEINKEEVSKIKEVEIDGNNEVELETVENISDFDIDEMTRIEYDFLSSFSDAQEKNIETETWLKDELKSHLNDRNDDEIETIKNNIISSINESEKRKEEINNAVASGKSKESYFSSVLKDSMASVSAAESTQYVQGLESALNEANESMIETILTKAGEINGNPNLDGFIAEQYHANTFNLNAHAAKSNLKAEVLKPESGQTYSKNSVDVVIKNEYGKIVSRYQLKYGKTAEDTIKMIREGDYRGQQLVVPADQVEEVQKAFPNRKVSSTIGDDKISSKPLTKADAKEMQKAAQNNEQIESGWNDFNFKNIAKEVGKQVGIASLLGFAIGGISYIGEHIAHDEKIEPKEAIKSSLLTGADFGIKAALAAAMYVAYDALECDFLPFDNETRASIFGTMAHVIVENTKTAYRVGTGELTVIEGVEEVEKTAVSSAAGLVASAVVEDIGFVIGFMCGGSVGAVIGGTAGKLLGFMAGSAIGQAVVKGAQKIRRKVVDGVKSLAKKIGNGIKNFANRLSFVFN